MGIAEKLTRIAENEQRVYDAGRQSERIKVEAEIAELEAEVTTLTEQKQTLEAEKLDLQRQNDELAEHYQDKLAEIESLNTQIAEKQSQIDTLNARIAELEAEVNSQIELRLEAEAEAKMWKADAVAQNELRLEAEAQLPIKYQEGHADGVKAERSSFWNGLQDYGNRDSYNRGFYGWRNAYDIFYPEHDIVGDCGEAFRGWTRNWNNDKFLDVAQRLEDCGVKLNTNGTNFSQFACYSTIITRFPVLDGSAATSFQLAFTGCTYLVTIDEIITNENVTTYYGAFTGCPALVHVIFKGVIAANLDISEATKLDHDSIESMMKIRSDSKSGLTMTFSLVAVNKAFETSEGANDGSTSQEWTALVDAKPNWSVALK